MRPSICPDNQLEALERLAGSLHLVPGAQAIDALWLRNGVRAFLMGEVASLDAALGLDSNTRRRLKAARRARCIRRIAAAVGLGPTWACAGQVLAIIAGAVDCPRGVDRECAELRSDPKTARSIEHVYRLLSE
jgi:hypothetical protein